MILPYAACKTCSKLHYPVYKPTQNSVILNPIKFMCVQVTLTKNINY